MTVNQRRGRIEIGDWGLGIGDWGLENGKWKMVIGRFIEEFGWYRHSVATT